MNLVLHRVHSDLARGALKTWIYRRQFLAHRAALRQSDMSVPEIVLVDSDETNVVLPPGLLKIDTSLSALRSPSSPGLHPFRGGSPDDSPLRSGGRSSPGGSDGSYDGSPGRSSLGSRNRDSSLAEEGGTVDEMLNKWGAAFDDEGDEDG